MIALLIILFLINAPIGYFLCKKLGYTRYVSIAALGVAQYVATALITSFALLISEMRNEGMKAIALILYAAGTWALTIAPFVLPAVLLYAWFLHWRMNRKA